MAEEFDRAWVGGLVGTPFELTRRVYRVGGYAMAHLPEHGCAGSADPLYHRATAAIERGLLAEVDCAKTLHLTAAVRGAVGGLMDGLVEAHLREHVADHNLSAEARDAGAEALIAAIRRYTK